jgi:hypothetical protein
MPDSDILRGVPGDCGKPKMNGQQPVSPTRARVFHLL